MKSKIATKRNIMGIDSTPQFKLERGKKGKRTKFNLSKNKRKAFYPSHTVAAGAKKELVELSHQHNQETITKFCYGCSEPIKDDEDYLSIDHRNYHSNCLKCQAENCVKSLEKHQIFDLEGIYYCKTCYFEFEKHICYDCKLVIRDPKYIKIGKNKFFHLNHFKCFKCGEEIPKIITNNNEAFITSYQDEENSEVESTENSIEDSLNEEQAEFGERLSLWGNKIKYEQNYEFSWFNDAPCCLNCFNDIGLRCYGCKDYIDDEYINIKEGRFHTYCVSCHICEKIIEDSLCMVEGVTYHLDCYMKKNNCRKCGFCEDYIFDKEFYEFRNSVSFTLI